MRLLMIAPSIFILPIQGYGGTETIFYQLCVELAKRGHEITAVCPVGSTFPAGLPITHVATDLREPEERSYHRYKDAMEAGQFDCVGDHTFEAWAYNSSVNHEPELPIVHTLHTSPTIYGSPPPVRHPRFIGISDSHCQEIRLRLGIDARRVYNGIDLNFYTPDPNVKRNSRYVQLGRYTPEKGFLVGINMCNRLRIPLDSFGDLAIVGDTSYVDKCRAASNGLITRVNSGVSREETVKIYRSYRGLLFPLQWPEPFGLTVLEANACGMGVLTLKKGALAETVENGTNGFACANEVELEEYLKNDAVLKIDPAKARAWAEKFSNEIMVTNYEKIFFEVAAHGVGW